MRRVTSYVVPSFPVLLVALAVATSLLALSCVYVMDAYSLTWAGGVALLIGVGGLGFAAGILLMLICTRVSR